MSTMSTNEMPVPPAPNPGSWLNVTWYRTNRRSRSGDWNAFSGLTRTIPAQPGRELLTLRVGRPTNLGGHHLDYTLELAQHAFHDTYVNRESQIPSRLLEITVGELRHPAKSYPVEVRMVTGDPAWTLWYHGRTETGWTRVNDSRPYRVRHGDSIAAVLEQGYDRRPAVAATFHLPTTTYKSTDPILGPWDLYRSLVFDSRGWNPPRPLDSSLGRLEIDYESDKISTPQWRNITLTLDALVMAAAEFDGSWTTMFGEHVASENKSRPGELRKPEYLRRALDRATTALDTETNLFSCNKFVKTTSLKIPQTWVDADHPLLSRFPEITGWEHPDCPTVRHCVLGGNEFTLDGVALAERLSKELKTLEVITNDMAFAMTEYMEWLQERMLDRTHQRPSGIDL